MNQEAPVFQYSFSTEHKVNSPRLFPLSGTKCSTKLDAKVHLPVSNPVRPRGRGCLALSVGVNAADSVTSH